MAAQAAALEAAGAGRNFTERALALAQPTLRTAGQSVARSW